MAVLLIWILLAILVGVYAGNKGRSGVGFFFLSLVLSPVISFIILVVSSPQHAQAQRKKVAERSGMKKCPACAEYVQGEALVCRFCGHKFGGVGLSSDAEAWITTSDIEKIQRRLQDQPL